MVLFSMFGVCFLSVLLFAAIVFEGEEFLLFAFVLTLAVIMGCLVMLSLPNH